MTALSACHQQPHMRWQQAAEFQALQQRVQQQVQQWLDKVLVCVYRLSQLRDWPHTAGCCQGCPSCVRWWISARLD